MAALSQHPVVRVLRARTEAGSQPGARADGHRVALVLEGGGMRGVVSAGMVAALERLGMRDAFDLIVGSSAGAINGMALLSGVARRAADAYCGPLASRSFVNPLRVLRGKPVLDVNDVLAIVTAEDVAGHERVTSGDIALHCIATDVTSATGVDLHGMRTQEDVWTAILASSRMPWAGGPPVEIGGRRYLDGGLVAPVPVDDAIAAGATHVLALQTRPFGVPRKSASRIGDRLIERHLRGLNPALVTVYRDRIARYELLVADLERRSLDHSLGPPYVLGLRPPAETPCVGQLERDPAVLTAGATDGERLVDAALSAGQTRTSPAARAQSIVRRNVSSTGV
jgi:predicted patatin/cPLA2 family phospholipase